MESALLARGVELMLVGMGTVFVFLTALVLAMTAMASLVKRVTPRVGESASDEEVAAITAAIALHRKNRS